MNPSEPFIRVESDHTNRWPSRRNIWLLWVGLNCHHSENIVLLPQCNGPIFLFKKLIYFPRSTFKNIACGYVKHSIRCIWLRKFRNVDESGTGGKNDSKNRWPVLWQNLFPSIVIPVGLESDAQRKVHFYFEISTVVFSFCLSK